ncbi:glutaredoxin 3 [Pleomorphomonas sp. JP5]|uniref:glutaredoxin 3 n=1 Tax=Pleomorphomonas sp. JP5 TaxID=2942998 RepID=UPI0020446B1E|nr:glutaredoxin 3 [Pleomorphomonas sp. JP5]MCM5556415.1 glutaredoxin 3 [Pleomorphomonas sp. JP5]
MVPVTIYTREGCGYCVRAKALLTRKGATFTEIDAGSDRTLKAEMMQRSGRSTFPQIFLGNTHVGGCDDLYALDAEGRLDALLAG